MNFIPRIIPSHGRTRTLTAVAKKRLKFVGVRLSCVSKAARQLPIFLFLYVEESKRTR